MDTNEPTHDEVKPKIEAAELQSQAPLAEKKTSSSHESKKDASYDILANSKIIRISQKSAKPKWFKPVIFSITFLFFAIGSFFLLFWYENPQRVVSNAVVLTAANAKKSAYDFNMMSSDGSTKMTATGEIKALDYKKFEFNVNFKTTSGDNSGSFAADAIADGSGNYYLKIDADGGSEVKGDGLAAVVVSLLGAVNGQWIKVSQDDISSLTGSENTSTTCVSDATTELSKDQSEIAAIFNSYNANPVIVAGDYLGTDGTQLGYDVSYNANNAKAFYDALSQTNFYKSVSSCSNIFEKDSTSTDDAYSTSSSSSTDKKSTEMWVNAITHQMTKLVFKEENGSANSKITIAPKTDDSITINIPSSSKSLSEVMKSYFSQSYSD